MQEACKKVLNARQERFAQLIAVVGLAHGEAAKQAGYSARSADVQAGQLLRKPSVASRIATLRSEQASKIEAKALISRQMIIDHLAKLMLGGKTEHAQLKAAELLAKMQGYNEPERQQVQHMHLHVDAGVMEQLRAGYAALASREASPLAALQGAPLLAEGALPGAPPGSRLPQPI